MQIKWPQWLTACRLALPAFAVLIGAVIFATVKWGSLCEVNWVLVLAYLKVLLGWPPIALVIAVLFIWRFQKQLESFFGRTTEANLFGQQFKAAPPPQIETPLVEKKDPLTEAVEASEATRENQPESTPGPQIPVELQGDQNASAEIAYVKDHPGDTVLAYRNLYASFQYEKLFNMIYGTQIWLLDTLSYSPGGEMAINGAQQHFAEYQIRTGVVANTFSQFLDFLIAWGAIERGKLPSGEVLRITDFGKGFLRYIKQTYPGRWSLRPY